MIFEYFDNAATTRVDEAVSEIVRRYNSEYFFNPSANYSPSVHIHNEISEARKEILSLLKGYNGTLYFLSSGTEGDNQTLFCTKKRKNANIVISAAEHPAIYNAALASKNQGIELRICPVDGVGRVSEENLKSLVDQNTALVSVMHVNNETGGINPIDKLCAAVKAINPDVLFHSDGVQAFGKVPVALSDWKVDLYTVSGHKIGAPKGVAALYVRKGVTLAPLIYGGGQENGIRSSTENVAGILAFAFAAKRANAEREANSRRYRDYIEILRRRIADIDAKIISDEGCSSHIFTFAFRSVRGEVMQHALEEKGFLVGTGSACSARRSHDRIPQALGLKEYSDGILRISFGRENTHEQAERLADALIENYEILKKYIGK